MVSDEVKTPVQVAYKRRNRDLDPQLVWRGKDGQDWSDLVVQAPPLYIQEKIHPKTLIEDLKKRTEESEKGKETQLQMFADFNGIGEEKKKTDFYEHENKWTNRMILGDSLQVMASLAEKEGLRGKVQCIYIDPPYGIKFNSNFQWSTTSRDVKDGKAEHITREPEQVKAFRDTWKDGVFFCTLHNAAWWNLILPAPRVFQARREQEKLLLLCTGRFFLPGKIRKQGYCLPYFQKIWRICCVKN